METNDLTTGVPSGCSTEDTTPTYQSGAALSATQAYDGTYSANGDGTSARVDFSTSTSLIANGKVSFRVHVGTYSSAATAFAAIIDSSNKVWIYTTGSSVDIRWVIAHTGGGTADTCTIPVSSGRTEDTWMYVEAGWKEETEAGNDIYIKVCDADGLSNCVTQEEDDDPLGLFK